MTGISDAEYQSILEVLALNCAARTEHLGRIDRGDVEEWTRSMSIREVADFFEISPSHRGAHCEPQ